MPPPGEGPAAAAEAARPRRPAGGGAAGGPAVSRRPRGEDDDAPARREEPSTVGQRTSHIKNKIARSRQYHELKAKADKQKKAERKKRAEQARAIVEAGGVAPPRMVPRTVENTRAADPAAVAEDDEEVLADEAHDEFAGHFDRTREPKVLLTTSLHASPSTYKFSSEMLDVLPRAVFYKRGGYSLKKIVAYASNRDFTDVIVVNEDRKKVNGVLVTHLPDGPTAHFALSKLKLGQDMRGTGNATSHRPELVLNNFGTRLGARVGRMFASLFHQDPMFRGRRVVTFHAQRDFIFFRHHRYIFEEKKKGKRGAAAEAAILAAAEDPDAPPPPLSDIVKVRLQEIGPRFTLRLLSLQKGTFDTREGEYEWVPKKEADDTKRHFAL